MTGEKRGLSLYVWVGSRLLALRDESGVIDSIECGVGTFYFGFDAVELDILGRGCGNHKDSGA